MASAQFQASLFGVPAADAALAPAPEPGADTADSRAAAMIRAWSMEKRCAYNLKQWMLFKDADGEVVFAVLYLHQRTVDGVVRVGVPAMDTVLFEAQNGEATEALFPAFAAMGELVRRHGVEWTRTSCTAAALVEDRSFVRGGV